MSRTSLLWPKKIEMARTKPQSRYAVDSTRSAADVEMLTARIRTINCSAQMGLGFTKREWIDELMLDRKITATRLRMHQERLERMLIQKKRILMHMR